MNESFENEPKNVQPNLKGSNNKSSFWDNDNDEDDGSDHEIGIDKETLSQIGNKKEHQQQNFVDQPSSTPTKSVNLKATPTDTNDPQQEHPSEGDTPLPPIKSMIQDDANNIFIFLNQTKSWFLALFPDINFENFRTKVNFKDKGGNESTYIDFLFNIKDSKHCEALWLYFHYIDPVTYQMHQNPLSLNGLPFKIYLNKKEEYFNSQANRFKVILKDYKK